MVIESRAARWVIMFMSVMIVLIVGVIVGLIAVFQIASRVDRNINNTEKASRSAQQAGTKAEEAKERAEEGTEQSKKNEDLLNIVLAITGCTVADTPEACAQRVATAGQEEGNRRIAEVDCRIRRALAGQPAPEGTVCIPNS